MTLSGCTIGIGVDSETDLIAPGRQAPQGTCWSFSNDQKAWVYGWALGCEIVCELLRRGIRIFIHNAAFDMTGLLNACPHEAALIFDAYEQDLIACSKVHAQLKAIANPMRVSPKYDLASLSKAVTGRDRSYEKGNDSWRLYYRELANIPVKDWPSEAVRYAKYDAEDHLDLARWQFENQSVDLFEQTRADFWLYLMGAWGIITDPELVPTVTQDLFDRVAAYRLRLQGGAALVARSGSVAAQMALASRVDLPAPALKALWNSEHVQVRIAVRQTYDVPFSGPVMERILEPALDTPTEKIAIAVRRADTGESLKLARLFVQGPDVCKSRAKVRAAARLHNKKVDAHSKVRMLYEYRQLVPLPRVPEQDVTSAWIRCENNDIDYIRTGYLPDNPGFFREDGRLNSAVLQERVQDAYDAMGKIAPTTPSDKISTARETLEGTNDWALELYAELIGPQKLATSFAKAVIAGMHVVINPWWSVLMETGRTSCRGPNLQNQPRQPGIRECFIPRPGNVFVNADYAIAELRTLAQVLYWEFGDNVMRDLILAGKDLHKHTGAAIASLDQGREVTYEEFDAAYKRGEKWAKKLRSLAKVVNFGFPGGLGAATFCNQAKKTYGLSLSLERGKQLKKIWLDTYPLMVRYFANRGMETHTANGFVVQPGSGRVRARNTYCQACNTRFQGLAADGAKYAGWLITRAMYDKSRNSVLYGYRMVAFIHDEFMLEGPEETAHEAAMELSRLMEIGMVKATPDVPAKAEPCLMRRWIKDADVATDENGRLVPWDDVHPEWRDAIAA